MPVEPKIHLSKWIRRPKWANLWNFMEGLFVSIDISIGYSDVVDVYVYERHFFFFLHLKKIIIARNCRTFFIVSGTRNLGMTLSFEQAEEIPTELMCWPGKITSDFPNSYFTGLLTAPDFSKR